MATIKESLRTIDDITGYSIAGPSAIAVDSPQNLTPVLQPMMRCPLPSFGRVSPDSLRQYYRGSVLPQMRVLSPSPQLTNGALGSGGGIVTSNSSQETLSGPIVAQTSFTTPILNSGDNFITTVILGKTFQIVEISTSSTARVELYGTSNSQLLDIGRPLDVTPPAGTSQGIILDLVLDQDPLTFGLQNITGDNVDNPQTNLCYVTTTNLGFIGTITVTIVYVSIAKK